jgi:hypothetical protein
MAFILSCDGKILLHNMMVEERVESDEVEDGSFYSTIYNEDNEDNEEENDLDNDEYNSTPAGRLEKFQMVHKRWSELYDYEGSRYLKDSMIDEKAFVLSEVWESCIGKGTFVDG